MNQKVKNITKAIVFAGLIASASSQAQVDLNSITTAIASVAKKIVYKTMNELIAVAPDWYQSLIYLDELYKLDNIKHGDPQNPKELYDYLKLNISTKSVTNKEIELAVKATLLFLNPIITSIGLETSRYMILDNALNALIKDEVKRDRVKKGLRTITQFFGIRIALSLLLRPLLLNKLAPELEKRIANSSLLHQ